MCLLWSICKWNYCYLYVALLKRWISGHFPQNMHPRQLACTLSNMFGSKSQGWQGCLGPVNRLGFFIFFLRILWRLKSTLLINICNGGFVSTKQWYDLNRVIDRRKVLHNVLCSFKSTMSIVCSVSNFH